MKCRCCKLDKPESDFPNPMNYRWGACFDCVRDDPVIPVEFFEIIVGARPGSLRNFESEVIL